MKILVAGGAGFLGTNLVKRLLRDGHQVVVIDNFSTGSMSNLDDLSIEIIKHDISLSLPILAGKFDVIVNMACQASPPAYQQHPIETLRVCSLGTEYLLQRAMADSARFVQASTSEVYGEPLVQPQAESYWGNVNSYGERAMYDEGKRYAEALIWSYKRVHNVNSGIIRIFNTYGPSMNSKDGRVITNFVHQALADQELTIYGDGRQTRSFCYVDDQIEAWIKMINSSHEGPINIGNPVEFNMLELIKVLEKVLGKKLRVTFKPRPIDDPTQRRPDITKAKELLNWEPKIQLEEGLGKMIEWINLELTLTVR